MTPVPMNSLERAITQRDKESAIAALDQDPSQADTQSAMGISMLMLALYYEQVDVAHAIRRWLPEISFFEAASLGEIETVRAEVERDPARVNALAPDGFPVLGLAIFFRQPELAQYLIEHGADVNIRSANAARLAPVHAACARQDLTSLRLLLKHGADPKMPQEGGFTPLDSAKAAGNLEMQQVLLDAGA